jgi:hypothetical protein
MDEKGIELIRSEKAKPDYDDDYIDWLEVRAGLPISRNVIVQCTGDDPYRCRGCSHLYPHKKTKKCIFDTMNCQHECKEVERC